MRSTKNHYFTLLFILTFAILGCNLSGSGDEASTKNSTNESEIAKNGDSSSNSTPATDTEKIPDIDFPDDDKTESTPENAGGDKTAVVKFAKGASAGNYKGSIDQDKTYTYIVDAAKGQTMKLELTSTQDNAGMFIVTPGGGFLGDANESEWTDNYNGTLPANGKYKVVVTTSRGSANFTLNVSVKGKSDDNSSDNSSTIESVGGLTTIVKFPKGGTFATYKNAVIRGERNKYILGASSGQRMEVTIDSVEDNAVFDIQAPNGSYLARERKSWNGQLPANGKYRIIVGGTRGNATYTVGFSVR